MPAQSVKRAFRAEVRERSFNVARELLAEQAWAQLSIAAIAGEVGVSRPTIYSEFGSKEGFGEALVLYETQRFAIGIVAVLNANIDRPIVGVEKATAYAIDECVKSTVIRAILVSGSGSPSEKSLLPFVTTRSAPSIQAGSEALGPWFAQVCPGMKKRDLDESVDAFMRVAISHLMQGGETNDQIPAKIGRVATKLFPEITV